MWSPFLNVLMPPEREFKHFYPYLCQKIKILASKKFTARQIVDKLKTDDGVTVTWCGVKRFLIRLQQKNNIDDAPRSGRSPTVLREIINFIDDQMKLDNELTIS